MSFGQECEPMPIWQQAKEFCGCISSDVSTRWPQLHRARPSELLQRRRLLCNACGVGRQILGLCMSVGQ